MGTVFLRAEILRSLERCADALADLERVIEADPFHEEALQIAGYVATQLGRQGEGRQYYRRYVELNPGNVDIRRTIAYEIYEAGDAEGAMQFSRRGSRSGRRSVRTSVSSPNGAPSSTSARYATS
jgi:tetratricopeptide (TPR) repeat protein